MSGETSIDGQLATPERGALWSTRRASGPPLPDIRREAHLLEPIINRAKNEPSRVVASHRVGQEFVDVTAAEFFERVRALAKGLIASQIRVGDRVAIMSRTRLEWVLLDYAILAVGGTTVPIYETSAREQVTHILADSGAVLALVESDEMRALAHNTEPDSSGVETLVIDNGALEELMARGLRVTNGELDALIDALSIHDTATIIYTSGTTGKPKGCVLTHRNLRTNVLQNLAAVSEMLGQDERSLFFLPLAHSYAKIISLVATEHGIKSVFASDVAHLAEEMAMTAPTMIVGVPRVFEKVFNAARQRAHDDRRGWVFDRAADTAVRFARMRARGRVTMTTKLLQAFYDRIVYRKVRHAFGGSLRFAFSGGSPLGQRLTYFFDGVGVRIFEGYGLTETSPTLTVNRSGAWRPGSVGQPVAGTEIFLAEDGEVFAAGPQVFDGYWRNPTETFAAFSEEGWFRTGDVGVLEDGFLYIVGRKKDLIVTAGGKNVAPEPMEDRLRAHPLISQAVVVGNNRPFVAALVTLDEEGLRRWRAGRSGGSGGEAIDDPELRAEIQQAVDDANASVSRAESIRSFTVLPSDLTIERGELTPTMKIRRALIEERYADKIDRMYLS